MGMGMQNVAVKLAGLPPATVHGLFALALIASAVVGRATNLEASTLALVWPAAGVSFLWGFWALRTRGDFLLAVAVTVPIIAAVNHLTGLDPVLSVAVAVGNAAQTAVATHLFRRLVPDLTVRTVGEFFRLGITALASCTFGALFLVAGSAMDGAAEPFEVFIPWLVRHSVSLTALGALGIVLMSALRSVSSCESRTMITRPQLIEYVALAAVSATAYSVTFGVGAALPIAHTTIPAHMWAGLRLRSGWAMAHGVACGAFLVFFTLQDRGPFQDLAADTAVYVAQSFMFIAFSLSAVLALSMDERRRLIDRLYTANQDAQASAELRDLVISKMNDGVFVAGPDQRLLFQNATSERWLAPVGAVGNDMFHDLEVRTVDGVPLQEQSSPLHLALKGVATERMDLDVSNASGQMVHLSVDAVPLPGGRGAVVVARNVTNERVQQRDLSRFASVVAHDLLTPLTVFDGWLEMLEDPDLSESERQASIERLQQASRRMRTLIRNLLAYSLAKEEKITAARLDVADVVEGIIDLRTALPGTQLAPVSFTVDAPHPVHADERLFLQLMENLVGNAMKYGRTDGSGEVTITTSLEEPSGRTLVHVADNGIGIPDTDVERVFDEFHRSENGLRQATGTGLGLAICRRIAESHGGTISVRNRATGGAQFTVALPGSPEQVPDGVPLVDAKRSTAPASRT